MPALAGISYEELPGSGQLNYSPDGVTGQRIFLVAWDDRIDFCKHLLGYAEAVGHTPIRTDAQTFPGYDYLYCQEAVSAGIGELQAGAEMASYPHAKITATYKPLRFHTSVTETDEEYDEDAEVERRYLRESYDFGGEFVNVPKGNFRYKAEPDTPVESPPGILVGTIDLSLESEYEPELNMAGIRACLGKINSTTWYGYGAGYVLFLGASARRTITSEGTPAWAVVYHFRARAKKWNWFYRGTSGGGSDEGWWEIENESGDPPYKSADFSILV